jgi:multidrug efflux system membrane fusion protein
MKKWLFVLLVFSACHKKQPPPVITSYPVRTDVAIIKEAPIFIEALGHVDSITAINIKSRIEGELTGVYFTQGQEVKKNDLLFTIDPRPYQAALKEAQAALDQNLANLALAAEKVKRYRTLAKDEYYSQIDYETLQANFAATAALVEQNRAQVDSALINLNYCWIYAPIDGMMGLLQVDFGNLVANDGNTLSTLNQMTPIYVTFSIPEFQLPKIQKYKTQGSLKVLAAYEDFTGEVFEGHLFMIDNSVDPKTGMITMRALFENSKRELWPGQFIRTRLILTTIPNAVIVPYTALQLTQNGPILFVVKSDSTVEQRSVTLGQREDDKITILKGIKEGEIIVTEGQLNLLDGTKVDVKK